MSLPLEMWVMIVRAGDLDAYDLIAMSAISRGWREAAHAMATFLPDEKRLAKVKPRSPDGVDRCNAWNLFASVWEVVLRGVISSSVKVVGSIVVVLGRGAVQGGGRSRYVLYISACSEDNQSLYEFINAL